MSDGLVSIIIPTYNRAHCLARAIDSALAQTHGELDVIVIDDGSTDGTRALVHDTYGKDERVRYVHQENRGVSAARNHGIRLVKGSYAALLDSDDVWKPYKLDLQLSCLRAFPDAGMVWSDMSAVSTGGEMVAERYLKRFYGTYRLFSSDDLYDRHRPLAEIAPHLAAEVGAEQAYAGEIYGPMVMGNLVHTSTVLLRRERLEASGFFDEAVRTGEDHEFHLATCRAGRVAYVDLPTILYEIGAEDALTRAEFNVPMARHFLSTLQRALARDGDRIRRRIPEATIDLVLADAHRWLGESLLGEGERREARREFLSCLRVDPRQPRIAAFYAASFLSPEARGRLVEAYRGLKQRLLDQLAS
jgi:glycosyltransferase involved in cell wall biosynthesis